jgi:cell division protein FtsZ
MKGARGLLISITGGRDMTLFEVDEAASRVREEVEPEANIIFGATFDESLEGIIRVSVVATGIEQERAQEPVAPPTAGWRNSPPSEVGRRAGIRCARLGRQQQQPQGQRESIPAYALEGLEQELAMPMPQVAPIRAAQPGQARPAASPARTGGDGGVRIGPFRPEPSLAPARYADPEGEHARANEAARASAPAHFHPPAAERPDEVQARMPRVEDFPAVAQRQIRANQAPAHGHEEDRRPRGLLARLTSGLSRRDEDYDEIAPFQPERA